MIYNNNINGKMPLLFIRWFYIPSTEHYLCYYIILPLMLKTVLLMDKLFSLFYGEEVKSKCLISSQRKMQVVSARDMDGVQANVNLRPMSFPLKGGKVSWRYITYEIQIAESE